MASSYAAIISTEKKRYDVFLSFRGEDTRSNFISHLHEALRRNQILTFIDYNLKRGDNISSLLTAIEESMISVIIFSQDYANSKWCLKELAKIFQCKHLDGQVIIPVFYGVDPSEVKNQTGEFGIAFNKLKERLQGREMDFNEVRSHLVEAATISGWNSQDIRPESELIKSIVGDILNKFNRMTKTLNLSLNLVGIGSHVERVQTLLSLESSRFRMVGLWGMGGIGKTTIARATFNHLYSRFDAFYFVESVSNELRNLSVDGLQEKMVLKLLEEESINMGNRALHRDFIMKQFQRKKVLIVLDDVEDATKAKDLLGGQSDHFFSEGTRILVTSRNKQVLKVVGCDENLIYEVKGLNEKEGLQLFSLRAFKQNHPTSNHSELSRRVLRYTRGNPMALVVLGHALFDKSIEEWESALSKLGEEPYPEIQKVLKISYDALCDEEKMIFLDIACFLVGKTMNFVVGYYEGYVKRIEHKLSKLVDKSLIIISQEKELEMHDLLKEMGRSIESANNPEERNRILNLKDVSEERMVRSHPLFLKTKIFNCFYTTTCDHQRSSMVEAIIVDLSEGEEISEFDCSVLSRLDSLKFLEFHRPTNEESKVRFGWEGFEGFPDEVRYFRWDSYPLESLPSNFCLKNLVELHMPNSAVTKLWTGKQNIFNLKVINLRGAKNLVEFPDVSKGRNIEEIDLWGCRRLDKIPPSVHHLPKLKFFIVMISPYYRPLLANFDSKVLETLSLCRGFTTFPQLASANVIRRLQLGETDIREVPSSVELLKGLEYLSMWGCINLSIISTNICKLKSLSDLNLMNCPNLESFPEIMEPMESLTSLNLWGCTRLKKLPNNFHNLKSLGSLYLNLTAITELPSSIQHLIHLTELGISGCEKLTSLPSFIYNMRGLSTIDANGCVSLKTISSSSCFPFESKVPNLRFGNCFNLDEEEGRRILDVFCSNINQRILSQQQQFEILLPWSTKFPQWFGGSQSVGSSLTLKLPTYVEGYGLAFCVVIKVKYPDFPIRFRDKNYMNCYYNGHGVPVTRCYVDQRSWDDIEHLLLWKEPWDLRKYFGGEASFQFRDTMKYVEVTRCGLKIFSTLGSNFLFD